MEISTTSMFRRGVVGIGELLELPVWDLMESVGELVGWEDLEHVLSCLASDVHVGKHVKLEATTLSNHYE
jgi:hypothetical protein